MCVLEGGITRRVEKIGAGKPSDFYSSPDILWVMKPSMRGTEDICFQDFGSKIFSKPTIHVPAAVNMVITLRVA